MSRETERAGIRWPRNATERAIQFVRFQWWLVECRRALGAAR